MIYLLHIFFIYDTSIRANIMLKKISFTNCLFQIKSFKYFSTFIPNHNSVQFNNALNLHLTPPLGDHSFNSFQYFSDVHADTYDSSKIPDVRALSPNLLIAGDVGVPTHSNVYKFLKQMSEKFNKIYYAPGNHEYDSPPVFDESKYNKYNPLLRELCDQFNNVILLDNKSHKHSDEIVIIGTTLWSKPLFIKDEKYKKHLQKHTDALDFINTSKKMYADKKIILLTHYLPTRKLIESKYLNRGEITTSFFASDVEDIIVEPIVACVSGHSHSVMNVKVNLVPCMLNAYGYKHESSTRLITPKIFTI